MLKLCKFTKIKVLFPVLVSVFHSVQFYLIQICCPHFGEGSIDERGNDCSLGTKDSERRLFQYPDTGPWQQDLVWTSPKSTEHLHALWWARVTPNSQAFLSCKCSYVAVNLYQKAVEVRTVILKKDVVVYMTFSLWCHLTPTTRILLVFVFSCLLELLLFA